MIAGSPRIYLTRSQGLRPFPVPVDHPPGTDIEFGDSANYAGQGDGWAVNPRGGDLYFDLWVVGVADL